MRDLGAIQRRFHALVTAGEGAIDRELLGTSRRLDVYAEMYLARLHDVLADDHPKLRTALGDAAFREVAAAYVRARPPTSFTIRDAGRALPAYLAARGDLPAWCAELAALERARVEVFDGPDAPTRTREAVAALPAAAFPSLALARVPASVVVPLAWTVDELWSEIEDGARDAREVPAPAPCARVVLVWRRDLRVLHRTLDADEAPLVASLGPGVTLADVADRLAGGGGAAPAARMVALLGRWLDAGILAA